MLNSWVLSGIIMLLIYTYIKRRYSYWQRHGLLQAPASFPFGNLRGLILRQQTFGGTFQALHDFFRDKNCPLGGWYFLLQPAVIAVDPEIIRCVLTKDFHHFTDRGIYFDEKSDPLSAHLFALPGTKWRQLRIKLTPTFTSGKMKMMFQTVSSCGQDLTQLLDEIVSLERSIDIKDIISRFTIDVIGSCAFGIECDSLKRPENEFRRNSSQIIEVEGLDVLRQIFAVALPNVIKFLGIPGVNPQATNFFLNVVRQTVNYRECNSIKRNDFLHLLIKLKKTGDLTLEQIAAQCFVFFLAGYETSSATMAFCLFELAQNDELQNKLRNEINDAIWKNNNELSYETLKNMPFLDQCIYETLRKYPPLPFLIREVSTDWHVPGTSCTLRRGTPLIVSLQGLHFDSRYYPQPYEFQPERFSPSEWAKRPPYTYLPFGQGPRVCIGARFGLMLTKVGLVKIIRKFQCKLSEEMKTPLTMSTKTFITASEDKILLRLKKIL